MIPLLHSSVLATRRITYLIRECLAWWTSKDFYLWEISSETRDRELQPVLNAVLVGRESIQNDVVQLLFPQGASVTKSGPWPRHESGRLAQRSDASTNADFIFFEVPPWTTTAPKGGFLYQTLTESVINLTSGYDSWLKTVNSSQLQRFRQSQNAGDEIIWSNSDDDLRRFYDSFYVPTAKGLHGELAKVPDFEFLKRKQTHHSLMILRDSTGKWLGGAFILKGRFSPWRYMCTGLAADVAADSKQRGIVNCRMLIESAQAAVNSGQKSLSLGVSPAAYNNGIFEYKRRFGATPVDHCLDYPVCYLKVQSPKAQAQLDHLRPYVIRQFDKSPFTARAQAKSQLQEVSAEANSHPTHNAVNKGILDAATNMGIATAVTMVLGLILRLILPRVYGPDAMGTFFFTESLAMMFLCALPLGLASYITREIPKAPERARTILSHIVPAQGLFALLLVAAMMFYLLVTGESRLTVLCGISMAVYSAAYVFHRSIISRVYLALGQSALIAKVEVAVRVILILLVGGVLARGGSILWIATAFAIAQVVGVLWILGKSKKDGLLGAKFKSETFKKMVVTSLPFFAVSALVEIYSSIDTIMLQYLGGQKEVAYYGAANKLKGAGLVLLPILQASLQPALSKAWATDKDHFRRLVANATRILIAVSSAIAFVMMVIPDVIAGFAFGGAFDPAWRTIVYLGPVLIFTYINVLMGSCLNIIGTGTPFLIVTAISVAINAALNIILVNSLQDIFGPGGGAAATALGTIISECFVLLMMHRIFTEGLDFRSLLKWVSYGVGPCLIAGSVWSSMISLPAMTRVAGLIIVIPAYLWGVNLITLDDLHGVLRLKFNLDRRR